MPLAPDQRYCLECGERRTAMSSVLLGGLPGSASLPGPSEPAPAPPGPFAQSVPPADGPLQRGTWLTVIAGVGVLLLAMGVGVLIGRSGSSRSSAGPAQVISVASPSAGTAAAPAEASFTDDWPSGTTGYTVQLQTLPQSGTTVSAVESAKSAASAKGAKAVGALKSEDFGSLATGSYVIYAGVYHKKAEAQKALPGLRKSFPGASVIAVSNRGSGSSSGGPSSSAGGSGAGSSPSKPAPSSVLKSLSGIKGKSYEEKSKNLPNVVSTG
ncbi:MAG TPA: hypothetical protein VES97_09535 [Solirubrobacteraceae bacterium]|nr:hypothetical protein [Solirubrobacteraceae bacterium]